MDIDYIKMSFCKYKCTAYRIALDLPIGSIECSDPDCSEEINIDIDDILNKQDICSMCQIDNFMREIEEYKR